MTGDPMGADGADSTGDQEELFPVGLVEVDGVQLKDLVKPRHKVETTCSLSRAEVPLRGGLPNPNKRLRMLITGIPAKLHPLPLREDDNKPVEVTGWKIGQDVRVDFVETVPLDDLGLVRQRFSALIAEGGPDALREAGALLDQLQAELTAKLQA